MSILSALFKTLWNKFLLKFMHSMLFFKN